MGTVRRKNFIAQGLFRVGGGSFESVLKILKRINYRINNKTIQGIRSSRIYISFGKYDIVLSLTGDNLPYLLKFLYNTLSLCNKNNRHWVIDFSKINGVVDYNINTKLKLPTLANTLIKIKSKNNISTIQIEENIMNNVCEIVKEHNINNNVNNRFNIQIGRSFGFYDICIMFKGKSLKKLIKLLEKIRKNPNIYNTTSIPMIDNNTIDEIIDDDFQITTLFEISAEDDDRAHKIFERVENIHGKGIYDFYNTFGNHSHLMRAKQNISDRLKASMTLMKYKNIKGLTSYIEFEEEEDSNANIYESKIIGDRDVFRLVNSLVKETQEMEEDLLSMKCRKISTAIELLRSQKIHNKYIPSNWDDIINIILTDDYVTDDMKIECLKELSQALMFRIGGMDTPSIIGSTSELDPLISCYQRILLATESLPMFVGEFALPKKMKPIIISLFDYSSEYSLLPHTFRSAQSYGIYPFFIRCPTEYEPKQWIFMLHELAHGIYKCIPAINSRNHTSEIKWFIEETRPLKRASGDMDIKAKCEKYHHITNSKLLSISRGLSDVPKLGVIMDNINKISIEVGKICTSHERNYLEHRNQLYEDIIMDKFVIKYIPRDIYYDTFKTNQSPMSLRKKDMTFDEIIGAASFFLRCTAIQLSKKNPIINITNNKIEKYTDNLEQGVPVELYDLRSILNYYCALLLMKDKDIYVPNIFSSFVFSLSSARLTK